MRARVACVVLVRVLVALALAAMYRIYVARRDAQPNLCHGEFDMARRQEAAASALVACGARVCCVDGSCTAADELGRYAGRLARADVRHMPLCVPAGLLVDGEVYQGPLSLYDLERICSDA